MNKLLITSNTAKKSNIVFMQENIMKIGLNHKDGYTTLCLDIQDMPTELRRKIAERDENTLNQLETYLDDYYCEAELDSISLMRGEKWDSLHRWSEVFSCCGILRGFIVKVRGRIVKAVNAN